MGYAENSWKYDKYSFDVRRAKSLLDTIINSDDPRYLRKSPELLFDTVNRIVDYKLKRAEAYKIDFYFDE